VAVFLGLILFKAGIRIGAKASVEEEDKQRKTSLRLMLRQVQVARQTCRWRSSRLRPLSQPAKFLKFSTGQPNLASDDFGSYSILLPEEPYTFGVSHIVPRSVPSEIARPYYAAPGFLSDEEEPIPKAERIALGGEAEVRLREAARLARKVREYAGTLVQVCGCDRTDYLCDD
jgi:hypothetical protein